MGVSTTKKTRDPYIVARAWDVTRLLARSVPAPQVSHFFATVNGDCC
jgi:ribosomal RNA assembly protein